MICLQTALLHLFPDAVLPDVYGDGGDWKITSDGKEARIVRWNRSEPEPSKEDLELAYEEALKEKQIANKQLEERAWRDSMLDKVLSRIDQYEKDQGYPEELRTSPIKSHDDFLRLLNDRKVLSDYPDSETFPFGERPILSGLAK
ncbi:XkdW family protein [Vibrio minamisatsumaniensis]|uniref:XkdW family protein n=1 Tax=Vibrio minamisatsumaniensis TaxID=2910243 RepID=UPI003D1E182E